MKYIPVILVSVAYCFIGWYVFPLPSDLPDPLSAGQLKGVIHLQTPISGGQRTVDEYIKLARQHNIDVLILTDHDTQRYEYGLWPFRWLTNRVVEQESVFQFGVTEYLRQIKEANQRQSDVLIIDGVESTPFYYWSGSPFKKNLSLNNRGQHMLVIGLKKSSHYQRLPLVANGYSKYDQYHGDQFDKPCQDLIDYVVARDGVVFWAHPEAKESKKIQGVNVNTLAYPTSLKRTVNYTGFSIFQEGYQKVGRPGGIWDEVLREYCRGLRKKPVWAIGELDDYGKKRLDSVLTIFLTSKKDQSAIMEALRKGQMYVISTRKNKPVLRLVDFSVSESGPSGRTVFSGEELTCRNQPTINIKLSYQKVDDRQGENNQAAAGVTVKIIRNGRLIKELNQAMPLQVSFQDNTFKKNFSPGDRTYYRLDVTDEIGGKLITNPIFVKADR